MDKELKKAIYYLVAEIIGLGAILVADILPTIEISGPYLVFLVGISGILGYHGKKILAILFGLKPEEVQEPSPVISASLPLAIAEGYTVAVDAISGATIPIGGDELSSSTEDNITQ